LTSETESINYKLKSVLWTLLNANVNDKCKLTFEI